MLVAVTTGGFAEMSALCYLVPLNTASSLNVLRVWIGYHRHSYRVTNSVIMLQMFTGEQVCVCVCVCV